MSAEFAAQIQALAAVVALILGVVAGILAYQQLRASVKQQRHNLGMLYVGRYWAIDDDLLRTPKGSSEHRTHQHRYLRLCEDEFEAAKLGWFDEDMWTAWHSWLVTDSQRKLIIGDLKECPEHAGPFTNMRRCLQGEADHHWRQCPARLPEAATLKVPSTATNNGAEDQ